ncbi:MAG: hypothetical protein IT462_07425 [Planctomycetes bacterium]|nr:hypothetical protein [Planctomycetota bacterium]
MRTLFALAATIALLLCATTIHAGPDKPKKREKDPEVAEFERAIYGKGWVATRLDGTHKSGFGAAIGILKDEDTAAIETRIAEAKQYRDAKVAFGKSYPWARRAAWVKTEHFELCCDIKKIGLIGVCGGEGAADTFEATLTYAERAERIWSDMKAVFGADQMPGFPKTIYLWDKDDTGRKNRNTVLRDLFKDFLSADHKSGGTDMHNPHTSNIWWDPENSPTDDKLWEHYTHIVAQMLLLDRSSQYGGDMNAFGWLQEGWAFYLTRKHRELDASTTILLQEGAKGKPEHISGSAYGATCTALAKNGPNPEKGGFTPFEKLFLTNVNAFTLKERIQCWGIVKYIIEVYGNAAFVKFIDTIAQRKKTPEVITEVLDLTLKQFQDEWVQYFTDKKFADKKKAELAAKRANQPPADPPK